MREYDTVEAGERIKRFLDDEVVQAAFAKVERQAMYEFKQAKTDEALRRAQALCYVTDTFAALLMQVVEEGQLARNDQA